MIFLKNKLRSVKDLAARGMNLWGKKNVTISGERVAKVDRVAAQVKRSKHAFSRRLNGFVTILYTT
jgi:hypothetical protein